MPYQLQVLFILCTYYLFYSITYPSALPEAFEADYLVFKVEGWRWV